MTDKSNYLQKKYPSFTSQSPRVRVGHNRNIKFFRGECDEYPPNPYENLWKDDYLDLETKNSNNNFYIQNTKPMSKNHSGSLNRRRESRFSTFNISMNKTDNFDGGNSERSNVQSSKSKTISGGSSDYGSNIMNKQKNIQESTADDTKSSKEQIMISYEVLQNQTQTYAEEMINISKQVNNEKSECFKICHSPTFKHVINKNPQSSSKLSCSSLSDYAKFTPSCSNQLQKFPTQDAKQSHLIPVVTVRHGKNIPEITRTSSIKQRNNKIYQPGNHHLSLFMPDGARKPIIKKSTALVPKSQKKLKVTFKHQSTCKYIFILS